LKIGIVRGIQINSSNESNLLGTLPSEGSEIVNRSGRDVDGLDGKAE